MNVSLPLLHLGRSGVAFSRLRKQHEQLMVSTEKDVPYLCGFNEGHCFSRGFIPQSWWNIKGLPPIDIHFFGRGGSPASMLGLYIPVFAVWLFSYACSRRLWGCTITRQHFRKVGPMGLQALPHDLRLNHVAPYHAVHMGCAYVYICIYTHVDVDVGARLQLDPYATCWHA